LIAVLRAKELLGLSAASVEEEIGRGGAAHAGFKHAATITKNLLSMIRKNNAQRRIFAFCAEDNPPYYEKFKEICKESGIEFIDGVPQAIRWASSEGRQTRASDGIHWNEGGHRICAEVIVKFMRQK
jgi:hypothetical protein